MTVDAEIGEKIFALERSLNERWSAGDCYGYLDHYHENIAYFDPVLEKQLVGRAAVVEHIVKLYQNPNIVRSEYLNPNAIVSEGGDLVVLSYNLKNYVADEQNGEKLVRAWNSTEVYRLLNGQWRIVHSNWAITRSLTTGSVS